MRLKDLLLALCVVIIWGVNFVVIKVGLEGIPPFTGSTALPAGRFSRLFVYQAARSAL